MPADSARSVRAPGEMTLRVSLGRLTRGVRDALLDDAPVLLVLGLFVGTALAMHHWLGKPAVLEIDVFSWWLLSVSLVYLVPAVFATLIYEVAVRGKRTLARDTWRSIARRLFAPRAMAGLLVFLVAFPALLDTFTALKSAIPAFVPYGPWDVRFMVWDRWLHFGHHPWELLQPVFGSAAATWAIDKLYAFWFFVLWMTTLWQAWHGDRSTPLRAQYLLCFTLCWVLLGVAAATLLSSAGPVYYGRVTGLDADPFAPLMASLQSINESGLEIRALWAQDYLWDAYVEADPRLFSGISAMPSLHVSTATLMAIVGFKTNRWVGWGYTVFALGILIGSVHLGWHYAVDGYLAILATFGLWWVSGEVVRWWRGRMGLAADRVV